MAAIPSATGDSARRKDLRAGRRTFHAWPLLPVPPGASRARIAPDVAWPQGAAIGVAEEWQDKADQRDLGQDFEPSPDQRPWQKEDAATLTKRGGRALRLCLLASVAFHLSLAAFLIVMPSPETVDVAGGGEVAVMLVGQQAFDAMAAGKPDTPEVQAPVQTLDAIETENAPTEATTTDETVTEPQNEPVAEVAPTPVQPTEDVTPPEPESAEPALAEPSLAANENVAINPESISEASELAPASPKPLEAETSPEKPAEAAVAKPIEEVRPKQELEPLPEPVERTAEAKPDVPKKVEKPKERQRPVKAVKKAEKNQAARARKVEHARGEAGDASANAQRGASDSAAKAQSAEPGNAAVSNYPGKIAAKLRRALKYPRSAVSGSRTGEARVAFTVLADGSASGIRLVASSGSPVLDQAAIDAVRRASPFPPIPDGAGRRQWPFTVPVLFRR